MASVAFEAVRVSVASAVSAPAPLKSHAAGVTRTTAGTTRTSATTSAYAASPTSLHFGDTGPVVKSIQQRLNQLGYFAGPVDGRYGADLREAVWAFKEVQGLPMNALTNSVITSAFQLALAHPKQPVSKFPHGGAGRIEINLGIQVLILYRYNKPYLMLHVSSGGGYYYCGAPGNCANAVTPDGSYTALSFIPGTITVALGFMRNPIFFIGTVYAIHGGEPVPWYPDSHGCVRIYSDVVNWFHNDVHIGSTPIFIFGTAPYRPRLAHA